MQIESPIGRRTFLQGAAVLTAASAAPFDAGHAQQVPNSAGSARPRLAAPDNACDCHMHIYDAARFPPVRPASRMQANAAVAAYLRVLRRTTARGRCVSGTRRVYAPHTRVPLHPTPQNGRVARGAPVPPPDAGNAKPQPPDRAAPRAPRSPSSVPPPATTTIDMIEPL